MGETTSKEKDVDITSCKFVWCYTQDFAMNMTVFSICKKQIKACKIP